MECPANVSSSDLSSFEKLPPELRQLIYHYTVTSPNLISAANPLLEETAIDGRRYWKTNEPPLARTNRLFRAEVLPLYYTTNLFTFPRSPHYPYVLRENVESWFLAIGEEATSLIEWVGADYCAPIDQSFSSRIGSLQNIRILARPAKDVEHSEKPTVTRSNNDVCECKTGYSWRCHRIRPVEYELLSLRPSEVTSPSTGSNMVVFSSENHFSEDQGDAPCHCVYNASQVCRAVYARLPRYRRLSFAMHLCLSYLGSDESVRCAKVYEAMTRSTSAS